MWLVRLRLLVAVFWAGSLWTIGYLVAPTLFATLHDSALAGTIVGSLLVREAWVSIACAALLFSLVSTAGALDAVQKRRLLSVIGVMAACALAIYLGVQPAMAALKEAAGGSPCASRRNGRNLPSCTVYRSCCMWWRVCWPQCWSCACADRG
jgi:hypothetical protein